MWICGGHQFDKKNLVWCVSCFRKLRSISITFLLLVSFVYDISFICYVCLLAFFCSFRLFRQLMLLRQQGFGYWHSKHLPLFAFTLWIDGCDSIMDKQRWKIQGRGPFYSWQRGLDVKNSIWDALIWGFVNTYYFKIFHV